MKILANKDRYILSNNTLNISKQIKLTSVSSIKTQEPFFQKKNFWTYTQITRRRISHKKRNLCNQINNKLKEYLMTHNVLKLIFRSKEKINIKKMRRINFAENKMKTHLRMG
jgi:hypothetical protein